MPQVTIAGASSAPGAITAKALSILGIRGIPASHGGFETFAEKLSLHLARRGWAVTVYCQRVGRGSVHEDVWQDIRRVNIPVRLAGPAGTVYFDLLSTMHAVRSGQRRILLLGYNTALFCGLLRLAGCRSFINMDGIEWKRAKWGRFARTWLRINERFGCWFGNTLIADHPEIMRHLTLHISAEKVVMIPYGAPLVEMADVGGLWNFGLEPGRFAIVVARAEPENSVLEIVRAFSQEKRNAKLVVLGEYKPELNRYHRQVMAAAGDEVLFPGPIYDRSVVESLRFHARFYAHGHQVGGTNPSLVEALGTGSPVLAHDNPFNRWVADDAGVYFTNQKQCADLIATLFTDDNLIERLKRAARERHRLQFTWPEVLARYERLLTSELSGNASGQ